jgi:N-acetyl-anhydromuramyl-L-alanine amidase AmpD
MPRWIVIGAFVACSSSASAPVHDAAPASPPHPPSDARVAADAAASTLTIVDAPMKWSDERAALTLAYRRQHSDPAATDLTIDPRVIILHYTAGGSAKSTHDYFDNVRIEAARKDLARAGAVNVSSHFIVDRDGTIYRIQPETQFARHCIGMNHIAIGIENAGDEDKFPLTDAQVAADAALIRDLVRRFPKITHVLGHYEVMKFHHPYYQELDPKYRNDKPDPGKRFMALVRDNIADLKLSGL